MLIYTFMEMFNMKTKLKKYVKNAGLMLSHMKFSESDFATVIEINTIKYNDEAWQLAMLINVSLYTYSFNLEVMDNGTTKSAQFVFEHEANKKILALIRESENL